MIRPKTLIVHVPSDGTPVPLVSQRGRFPYVIRTDIDVRIGSVDSVSSSNGLLLLSGSVFGMTAADYPDDVEGNLYVCAASGVGGKVTGLIYERC